MSNTLGSDPALPSVSVVIPTYNRPQMMREALNSVLSQSYRGNIEVIVVFDKSAPDLSVECSYVSRRVRVMKNSQTSGLAGARNTGILAARGDLVAFCDDDDTWVFDKLEAQVRALQAEPEAEFCTTSMLVALDGKLTPRLARCERITFRDLLRSRMSMLHSSSFVARRLALVNGIGLVDETLPRSMAEDWELLLRASKRHDIVNVDRALVVVRWGATSYFADQWALRNAAQMWLMDHYPEMLADRGAAGLCYGKLAFGEAVQGNRRSALHWAKLAFGANWRELRTYFACAVALKMVSPKYILRQLSQHGHGI